MPINPNNPVSGLTPAQLKRLQSDLESQGAEKSGQKTNDYAADRMESLTPSSQGPKQPATLSLYQGGLHPGSGFPLGTLQTSQGYLIVPSTQGFGFSVYAPGSNSVTDKPAAKTFGTTLLGPNGEILADFKNSPNCTLPFGFSVSTHSSNPSDPFNGSISFDTGRSKMQWNVVEGVQDRVSQDQASEGAANTSITADQADLAKDRAAKNKGGTRTGLGIIGMLIGPLPAIAGGIAAAIGIAGGSKAARHADKDKAHVAQDQAQIASAQADEAKASQNVYEVEGTRRFMSND